MHKRKCRRWPHSIFSNMVINLAGNNAGIIFDEKHPANDARKQDQHYNFLTSAAAYQLVSAYIQHPIQNYRRLSTSVKEAMKLLRYDTNIRCIVPTEVLLMEKKKWCSFCPRPVDRKTRHYCSNSGKSICDDHRSNLYASCLHIQMFLTTFRSAFLLCI